MKPPLRVAMIGHAFMGAAHSQAWRTAPHFFDLPLDPEMAVVVGRDHQRAADAAARLGWAESVTDWREVVARDDIDLIDICTPGDTHEAIALAALAAGKHVLCEKPLANSVGAAERMAQAARQAFPAAVAMCGFSYRRSPALAFARELIAQGRLGEIRHVRGQYLQDWLSDAETPLTWRLDKSKAGSGALGDIGAHLIDTAQWLIGENITGVSSVLHTFVPERPIGEESGGLSSRAPGGARRGPVTVDDAALFTARFVGGAIGIFEATRFALGRRNANRIEINGSRGSLSYDFERMNELEFYESDAPAEQGFRRIQMTEPEHPYAAHWWPPGHGLGYEHLFTHQVVDLIEAIATEDQPRPSFDDALGVQRVLDAIERSAADRSIWTPIDDAESSGGPA